MSKDRLKYYAFFGATNSLGILQKIENTVEAANAIGYEAESKFYLNRIKGLFEFIKDVIAGREEVIILRLYDIFMPFLFPFLLYRRIKGTRLILDIPTPRITLLQELRFDGKSKVHIFIRSLWSYLSWTWILIPFNRIVQYAEEGRWFSFCVSKKTIKLGNGIKIDPALPLLQRKEENNELHLIAVASLAAWHGYDRLLKALALVKEAKPEAKISLKIVGNGPVLADLKRLANELDLLEQVEFTGLLHGDGLTDAFNGADMGVSSLGLFRIGLNDSSVLKVREYMARGLCVIGAGKDPDFPDQSPYRLLVPNDESIEPIAALLLKLIDQSLPSPLEVRGFAEEKLSYNAKIRKIIGR